MPPTLGGIQPMIEPSLRIVVTAIRSALTHVCAALATCGGSTHPPGAIPIPNSAARGGIIGYTDLFPAGLGLDITGAVLLAKGLGTLPDEYARRFMASWHSFAHQYVRAAEDFADGRAGVRALIVGFGFQSLGYVLAISGASARTHGAGAVVIAVLCTAVAIGSAYVLARMARWRKTRWWLLELAHWDGERHSMQTAKSCCGAA